MDLKEWLYLERRTAAEFASMLDYSAAHLRGIMAGMYNPSRKLIQKIERATNGQVTRNDFPKYRKEMQERGIPEESFQKLEESIKQELKQQPAPEIKMARCCPTCGCPNYGRSVC